MHTYIYITRELAPDPFFHAPIFIPSLLRLWDGPGRALRHLQGMPRAASSALGLKSGFESHLILRMLRPTLSALFAGCLHVVPACNFRPGSRGPQLG